MDSGHSRSQYRVAKKPPKLNRLSHTNSKRRVTSSPGPDIFGEAITLEVGSGATPIMVHRNLLVSDSPFARTALLKEPWASRKSKSLELIGADPGEVNLYVKWLYTGKIYLASVLDTPESRRPDWKVLIDAYILGDFLLSTKFMNAVMAAILEKWRANGIFPVRGAKNIYKRTAPGSKLRKVCVDFHVHFGLGRKLEQEPFHGDSDIKAEFLLDVVKEFATGSQWVWLVDKTEFWNESSWRYMLQDEVIVVDWGSSD